MSEAKPFSYHTFLFPFRWDMNDTHCFTMICRKLLSQNNGWEEMTLRDMKADSSLDQRVLYNEYMYFHDNVRNAVYGDANNDVVRNFVFRKDVMRHSDCENGVMFRIIKYEKTWTLTVKSIKLKLFNTGVGILIYELLNYEHCEIDDILKINEFGRRVALPYVSDYDNTCGLVADHIIIEGISEYNYKAHMDNGFGPEKADFDCISPIITDVLGDSFTFSGEKGKIKCYPIGDDRMFVCCLVDESDKDIRSSLIRENMVWDSESKQYEWEKTCYNNPHYAQKKLYDFVFIDGNGISCIDRNMRYDLLKKHLYTRHGEYDMDIALQKVKDETQYGTFFGITQHSMVCATNFDGEIVPFTSMRTQLAIIALAQRASIIALNCRAASLSKGFDGNGEISDEQVKEISKLQELYVAFRNQLLFLEASPQEQGIDLYGKLQEFLLVLEEEERFERQLKNLHEIATMHREQRINTELNKITKWGFGLAIASIIISVITLIHDFICK